MLCDRCKERQATVHTVTIVNGVKQEHFLCPECAKGAQFKLPSLMDVLSGCYAAPQAAQGQCGCGSSLARFQESGLLGCPDCYREFRSALIPVIKRAQGGRLRHVGRRPVEIEAQPQAAETEKPEAQPPASELERLRQELAKAVAEERYERAAELRDRIRAMEQEG